MRQLQATYVEKHKILMKEIKDLRDSVVMDWKTQRSKDDSSPQIDLICLVELISRIFCRYRRACSKVYLEMQGK